MKTASRALLTLAALLALPACDTTDLLGPVNPEEVTITLAVTGGFAAVDYAITVDGRAGEVRGVRCVRLCDFVPGELLVALSSEQVAELARRLDESGVMELNGTDFGSGCCDLLYVDLTYVRGPRATHVRGRQDRLPEALAVAVRHIEPLARRTVPLLVSPSTSDSGWPRDPYVLGAVTVQNYRLTAEVTYGGGCRQHRMDLVAWGGWMESFPVQINALVTHEDGDDPCDAVATEVRSFDLIPLALAYEESFGPIGQERPTVILRLWDPLSGSPVGRLVEVVL
jgi:hypothetical protein